MKRIPFLAPTFPAPQLVAADYAGIVARGIYTNGGPMEADFAAALETWIGRGVAVSLVASCTAALELAIQALMSPGASAVVVPSFTFAAGPLAIRRRGLQPRFIDIDPVTWQPSLADAEVALAADNGVGGILLSNSFGVANAEIGAWEDLAHRHGIPLILDSAAGLGSTYPWHEPLGGRGSCEVFSFHATKTLAVGEGGALASRDLDVIAAVDRLKNFGFDGSHQAITAGTNGKLTELAAAIGLRQMEALPDRLRRRRAVFDAYISRLQPLGLEFQPGAERSALAFVSALLPSRAQRDALVAALDGVGVECRMYYKPPVHRHPVFAGLEGIRPLVGTEDLCSRIISLPMADGLDADAVARIGSTAEAILRG